LNHRGETFLGGPKHLEALEGFWSLVLVRFTLEVTKRLSLLFSGHGDGTFGTDEGADSTAFAEIIIDFNVAGLLVSGNAEIRAKVAAQVAAPAEIVSEAPARLHDR
jgi:hypothetical protein